MKKLAVCVPTFNRAQLLDRLLNSIPVSEDIMVSICDDGSKDNTLEIVQKHKSRISINYVYQRNSGRAGALRKSILNAEAEFVMVVDSDDYIEKEGIEIILKSLKKNTSVSFFVFPITIFKNSLSQIILLNGIPQTNYVALRSDFGVKGDLQEVISHKLLLNVMYEDPKDIRRIPTSYLWFKASEQVDCLPVESLPVKVKEYSKDGMSANLLPLKVNYPKYLVSMYKIALRSKQFKSLFYRFKYTILFYRYSFHNKTFGLLKLRDFPFYLIGFIYGLFDLLMLSIFYKK
jgi:glycosyltransferase involved in cell wall biosynthesis